MRALDTFFWGTIVQPIINRSRKDDTARYLKEMRPLPFMSRSDAEQYQLERLQELLLHCYRNVPYYARLFAELTLKPSDFRALADLQKLPILTKKTIVENKMDFVARNISKNDLFPKATGGSTGTPLELFYDRSYGSRGEAGLVRSFEMAGYRVGEPVVILWSYPENLLRVSKWQQRVRQEMRRRFYFDTGKYGSREMEGWMFRCRKIKPAILYGYASAVYHFARFLKERGERLDGVKGVFTTSEKLYPFQRDLVSEVFDCKVYDNYGCVEVLHLAFECPEGGLHRSCDFSYIETQVDEERGLDYFLVTSLWNYGFPILRYKNNDVGRLLDKSCTCGRGFPLLDLDISRIVDNFPIRGGEIIHGTKLMHLLYGCEGIDRYQFYQPSIDRIILYIVKDAHYSTKTEIWLDGVKKQIDGMTNGSVLLDIQYVEEIPPTKAGKYLYMRSDVYRS